MKACDDQNKPLTVTCLQLEESCIAQPDQTVSQFEQLYTWLYNKCHNVPIRVLMKLQVDLDLYHLPTVQEMPTINSRVFADVYP